MVSEQHPQQPRLRSGEKISAPYPLGRFPSGVGLSIGKQVIYSLMTKPRVTLEGTEWEQIFARAIGAEWTNSTLGLDDVRLGNCAWGAKTIKQRHPWTARTVRLISGRNSPLFSYHKAVVPDEDPPEVLGEHVIGIWNARVDLARQRFALLRTVVLIKSEDLTRLAVFETETVRYNAEQYEWMWNARGNLEGWDHGVHKFTWQPHGSQFTIIETVPESRLCLYLTPGPKLDQEEFLKASGFEESWVKVVNPRND